MTERSESLDLLRGLAALLVMLGHLRSVFFVPFSQLTNPNLFYKIFYFVTGYGHECVMVFFVLSGYFVGSAFHKNFNAARLSDRITNYSINRMVRLWVVLLPALVFTVLIDKAGIAFTENAAAYTTSDYFAFIHPSNDRSLGTFIGNTFFLQTIEVPTYGTNTPLWSLANEFWYYLLFPAFYLIVHKSSSLRLRLALSVLMIPLCYWLIVRNDSMAEGFLIWLMGFAAALVNIKPTVFVRIGGVVFFTVLFIAVRAWRFPFGDILLGIGSFCLIAGVRDLTLGWFGRIAVFLSKISYTLYLVHLPLIVFLSATVLQGYDLKNDAGSVAVFLGLVLLMIGFSYLMYFFFERNTDRVRRFVRQKITASS